MRCLVMFITSVCLIFLHRRRSFAVYYEANFQCRNTTIEQQSTFSVFTVGLHLSTRRVGRIREFELCKQETSSRICIPFENSPSPSNVYTEKHRTVQFRPCFENVRNYTFGFFWKAVLPRHKLKLCFPKLNCR